VNEEVGGTLGWRNEAEASIVVPLCQGAMRSHESRLTAPFSGRPRAHQHAGAQDLL
jgi:hypothetical protein